MYYILPWWDFQSSKASSFAISSLSRVTTPKSIGMPSKKKYVESIRRRVSPKMKYLGDFLTKDVAARELVLEPAKSAYSTGCQLLCTSLPRSFDHWSSSPEKHSTGWPCRFCFSLRKRSD